LFMSYIMSICYKNPLIFYKVQNIYKLCENHTEI